jgi:hypothetical protein
MLTFIFLLSYRIQYDWLMLMTEKVVRKSGKDESGSKYNEFGLFSSSDSIPKGHEAEVKRIKTMLSDLFAQSQKNGGFVLIMAKDGKGNVRSSMAMNSMSSTEALAFAVDAEFKMKTLLKSIIEQSGIVTGIDIMSKHIDEMKKSEDKSVG